MWKISCEGTNFAQIQEMTTVDQDAGYMPEAEAEQGNVFVCTHKDGNIQFTGGRSGTEPQFNADRGQLNCDEGMY